MPRRQARRRAAKKIAANIFFGLMDAIAPSRPKPTAASDRALLKVIQPTECDCDRCKNMCEACPCWPTPDEASLMLDAGLAPKLVLEQFEPKRGERMPKVCVVAPRRRWGPFFMPCIFQTSTLERKCELHGTPMKPTEGRLAFHGKHTVVNGGGPIDVEGWDLRRAIARTWNTKRGRAVVQRFHRLRKEVA